jgi:hypothetical protein
MPYDPRKPHHERYIQNPPPYDPKLLARVEKDALTLCRALGYDLNTVEFAVEDGIPYAIDFMNPAPDADLQSVGQANFEWIVREVADLSIAKAAHAPAPHTELRWSTFLAGTPEVATKKTAGKRSAAKNPPAKKSAAKKRSAEPAKQAPAESVPNT